jgi:hypothetical protein
MRKRPVYRLVPLCGGASPDRPSDRALIGRRSMNTAATFFDFSGAHRVLRVFERFIFGKLSHEIARKAPPGMD